MGVDYVVDKACPVKDAVGGVAALVGLVKQRLQAESVLAMAREEGDERPPAEITVAMQVQRPEGVEQREVSVQELLDATAALDAQVARCEKCPARALEEPFGCYGYVSYPISANAEQWLLSLLPDSLDSTAGAFLAKALQDFGWDGAPVAELRKLGQGAVFESDEPFMVEWGDGEEAVQLDTNMLFQMLFFVGPVQPTHALMLCLFFGLLPHDIDQKDLQKVIKSPEKIGGKVKMPTSEDPDVQFLLRYLHALVTTAKLGVNLLVDG
jgi:hypothetical protein